MVISAAALLAVGALLYASVSPVGQRVKGRPSAKEAAAAFVTAVAAGDTTAAASLSDKAIDPAGFRALRLGLFGTVAPLEITGVQLGEGWTVVTGTDPATYLILHGYSVDGKALMTDIYASSQYQIGVELRGTSWVVVSWNLPAAR